MCVRPRKHHLEHRHRHRNRNRPRFYRQPPSLTLRPASVGPDPCPSAVCNVERRMSVHVWVIGNVFIGHALRVKQERCQVEIRKREKKHGACPPWRRQVKASFAGDDGVRNITSSASHRLFPPPFLGLSALTRTTIFGSVCIGITSTQGQMQTMWGSALNVTARDAAPSAIGTGGQQPRSTGAGSGSPERGPKKCAAWCRSSC